MGGPRINIQDYIGLLYGALVVVEVVGKVNNSQHYYLMCKCKCGNIIRYRLDHLENGLKTSCGCDKKSRMPSYRRLYNIWYKIKQRCTNPSYRRYKQYGGKGIKICREWDGDFLIFYEWSIKNGYKDNLTLDRILNNGNYQPSNCRWATQREQQNNRTNNVVIKYKGQQLTIAQWSEKTGISASLISYRHRNGLDLFKKPYHK